jgi:hypothetical protein
MYYCLACFLFLLVLESVPRQEQCYPLLAVIHVCCLLFDDALQFAGTHLVQWRVLMWLLLEKMRRFNMITCPVVLVL